jgi:nitrogen fixation-related uncharacterized protein
MNSKGRESAQRLLAIIVIVAMLSMMGIPTSVLIFFSVVTYFIWRAVQRSDQQDTGRIFDFYINANDILRDDERRWFGFEIKKVIDDGERVLHSMNDAPPLVSFALGALYHHAGDHEAAVEHLSYVEENDLADERHSIAPSQELRRYVHILRKLEREPAEGPQTMAAIRSLERARRLHAASLLNESRERLKMIPTLELHPSSQNASEQFASNGDGFAKNQTGRIAGSHPVPAPIADVLRDVWEEEKKTA